MFKKLQRREKVILRLPMGGKLQKPTILWAGYSHSSLRTHVGSSHGVSLSSWHTIYISWLSQNFFFSSQKYFLFSVLPLCLSLPLNCVYSSVLFSSDFWGGDQRIQPHFFQKLTDLYIAHLLLTAHVSSVAEVREQAESQVIKCGHQKWRGWAEVLARKSIMASVGPW